MTESISRRNRRRDTGGSRRQSNANCPFDCERVSPSISAEFIIVLTLRTGRNRQRITLRQYDVADFHDDAMRSQPICFQDNIAASFRVLFQQGRQVADRYPGFVEIDYGRGSRRNRDDMRLGDRRQRRSREGQLDGNPGSKNKIRPEEKKDDQEENRVENRCRVQRDSMVPKITFELHWGRTFKLVRKIPPPRALPPIRILRKCLHWRTVNLREYSRSRFRRAPCRA